MSISSFALDRGRDFQLTAQDIEGMVHRAARHAHPIGNVRFMEFWFLVQGGDVALMGKIGPKSSGVKVSFPDAISCTRCRGTMLRAEVQGDGTENLKPCRRMASREFRLCDRS